MIIFTRYQVPGTTYCSILQPYYLLLFISLFTFNFSILIYLLSSPFFSLSLQLVALHPDSGVTNQAFRPPLQFVSCLAFFWREYFRYFFPRRLASNCAYPRYNKRSQQLSFLLFRIISKSHHGDIRTPGPTLLLIGAFGGNY